MSKQPENLNIITAKIMTGRIDDILPDYAQEIEDCTMKKIEYWNLNNEYRKIINYRKEIKERFSL